MNGLESGGGRLFRAVGTLSRTQNAFDGVMMPIRQVPDRLEKAWATGIDWLQQKRDF